MPLLLKPRQARKDPDWYVYEPLTILAAQQARWSSVQCVLWGTPATRSITFLPILPNVPLEGE